MTSNTPRPLPPRALPPLQTGDATQPSRGPRRKPKQPNVDGSVTSTPRDRPRRRNQPRPQRSREDGQGNEEIPTEERSIEQSGMDDSQLENERRPVKRRRRRPTADNPDATTGSQDVSGEITQGRNISSLLNDEDVVNVEKIDEAVILTNLPGVAAGAGGSAITDKVYVQTTNGFSTHNQQWIDERNKAAGTESRVTYGEDIIRASHIAAQNERGFMFIALMLHGVLAGFAIWQVVVSYSLLASGETNFLTQYQSLAQPTQTVYYIVLVLCTVSAMDRYDFAGPDKSILMSLVKFDLAAWGFIVYYIALLFSIGMAGLEAWLGSGVALPSSTAPTVTSATPTLPAELTGEDLDVSSTLSTWLILNVFRAVLSCLGWLIIAVDPLRNDMKWEE